MNFINKLAGAFILLFGLSAQLNAQSKPIDLQSPNGGLTVTINLSDKIYYSISGNNQELLIKNHLALTLNDGALGDGGGYGNGGGGDPCRLRFD